MPALLPSLKLDSNPVLKKHFAHHQICWIEAEDHLHAQGRQVCALAEKSIRIGWTYADAFKNVRKRLRFKKRDYLFVTKDYPSALEYMQQAWEFANIFNLTHNIVSHGEEFMKKAVLAAEFKGLPISAKNLSDWKKTGFQTWKLTQTALAFTEDSFPDDLPQSTLEKMSAKLIRCLQIRYAAVASALPPVHENPELELRRLGDLCNNLTALRRGDLSAERLSVEQQRLALEKSRTDSEQEKLFWQWTKRPDIQEILYPHRDPDQTRREVERMLNRQLLGIDKPAPLLDESIDPAVLI